MIFRCNRNTVLNEVLVMISSEQQFNANAARYAAGPVHRFGPSLPVLLEMADPTHKDVALDVATGTGNTALALAPFVSAVTGLDVATPMLEQASKRAREEGHINAVFLEGSVFSEGSGEALPFGDASFDLVTSRNAPHHFRDAQLENAPDEIRLKRSPDGTPPAHHEPLSVVRTEKK